MYTVLFIFYKGIFYFFLLIRVSLLIVYFKKIVGRFLGIEPFSVLIFPAGKSTQKEILPQSLPMKPICEMSQNCHFHPTSNLLK